MGLSLKVQGYPGSLPQMFLTLMLIAMGNHEAGTAILSFEASGFLLL